MKIAIKYNFNKHNFSPQNTLFRDEKYGQKYNLNLPKKINLKLTNIRTESMHESQLINMI